MEPLPRLTFEDVLNNQIMLRGQNLAIDRRGQNPELG